MATKIPISIKLDEEIFSEIEKRRGNKGKSPFIEEILKERFSKEEEYSRNTQEYLDRIRHLEEETTFLQERVKKLEILLDQEQKLHLQTQSQLLSKLKLSLWNKLRFWRLSQKGQK